MLEDLIKEELVKSMKERDALRVSTLRMIVASIKDLEISRRSSNSNQIKDEDIIHIRKIIQDIHDSSSWKLLTKLDFLKKNKLDETNEN